MRWRPETAANVTGPDPPCIATSIIAVTAKRPFVVKRMLAPLDWRIARVTPRRAAFADCLGQNSLCYTQSF